MRRSVGCGRETSADTLWFAGYNATGWNAGGFGKDGASLFHRQLIFQTRCYSADLF